MPLIWCSISSHGFGHAAQVAPVLNELGRLVPDLKAILRTKVPPWFFENRLTIPWELSQAEQDIGCVQRGPLEIDVKATWAEHLRFHRDWETKVREEAGAIRSAAPDLVLSDISHLAIEAGATAKRRTVGLCNLSWDRVLEPFLEPGLSEQIKTLQQIERAYGLADLLIRPAPGVPMKAFPKIVDISPISQPTSPNQRALREAIGSGPEERVVLIAFGGIPLDSLPFEKLERLAGYRFVVSGPVPEGYRRIRSHSSVPLPFNSLLVSADLIVTKPGYSTIVEAVAHCRPVVYVRRYNFVDEAFLVDYLHRHGRGVELTVQDFFEGRWQDALDTAQRLTASGRPAPPATGAAEAAEFLRSDLLDRR
ncbi:MAG: hypothetical protein E6K63_03665 [Nitrospirae bacterium]|nr:MAG: hypothetical protein E6K63_03665 [Nitrospirota bacterium]